MGRVFFASGLFLFLLGLILVIVAPIGKHKNKRCSVQTQGVLREIRVRHNSRGNQPNLKIYSYTVDGIEYQLKSTAINPHASRVGDQCPIWYNPKNPKDALEYQYASNKLFNILIIVGIVMLLSPIWLSIIYMALQ